MEKPHRLIVVKKQILILSLLCLFMGLETQAQRKKIQNRPNYEDQRLHFGFSVGFNFYDFHIQQVGNLVEIPGYYSISTVVNPGYNINIISNLRLTKYMDIRFNPGFASTSRMIKFDILDPNSQERETVQREITTSAIEFPIELKYRAKRINNYSMYVIGGFKYNKDLASKENSVDERVFKIKSNDLFYEFGFGLDFYFEYFKFSPQIKASFGFADILVQDGTFLIEGINRLESRSILLNFTFE